MSDDVADDGRVLEDHGIVIAITRYPKLSRASPGDADLHGLEAAKAVQAWLVDHGGVKRENIRLIVRAVRDPETSDADPNLSAVMKAFSDLYDLCWDENGQPIIPFGRRLYVYISGHGFAIDDDDGAVFCSEASSRAPWGVAAIKVLTAFRRGNIFKQFVLWVDACMDWEGVEPVQLSFRTVTDTREPPGPLFKAYAARPRLKTVEAAPNENGDVYGVFTRTLLDGLNGMAANANGEITGELLKDYLYNTMAKHIPPEHTDRKDVDKQPFIRVDPGIVFAHIGQQPVTEIVLQFEIGCDGAQARIWGRDQNSSRVAILRKETITNGRVAVRLPTGIYAVDVPDHGLRIGIEVTGNRASKIAAADASATQATAAEAAA